MLGITGNVSHFSLTRVESLEQFESNLKKSKLEGLKEMPDRAKWPISKFKQVHMDYSKAKWISLYRMAVTSKL